MTKPACFPSSVLPIVMLLILGCGSSQPDGTEVDADILIDSGDAKTSTPSATGQAHQVCDQPGVDSSNCFLDVSPGAAHVCAVRADNTGICWGDNSSGQTTVPNERYSAIRAGGSFSCGITALASIDCWGDDTFGQSTPPAGHFLKIAAGQRHACAIRTDSTLACWGDNSRGEASAPTGKFIDVAAGIDASCAVRLDDGSAVCWGNIAAPLPGVYASISMGDGIACSMATNSDVFCWGDNSDYGEKLADGWYPCETPCPTPGLELPATGLPLSGQVAAGKHQVCALFGGYPLGAPLGCAGEGAATSPGTRVCVDLPLICTPQVSGQSLLYYLQIAFSVGGQFGCGLLSTGALICWGHPPAHAPADVNSDITCEPLCSE